MTHFGIVCPPVSGHIHPFGALGRELQSRGHRVSVFHMADVKAKVTQEGLEFVPLGQSDHPEGSLPLSLQRLGRLSGLGALRFTVEAIRLTTAMFCRDAPAAMRSAGVQCLLVDQTEPAGASIADHLGIPYVTLCMALVLHREEGIPPPFLGALPSNKVGRRLIFSAGDALWDWITAPIFSVVQESRQKWGLAPYRSREESLSKYAQISQQVAAFDFPRHALPPCFSYVGPLRRPMNQATAFPWDQLDGRPVVYASLGTLQGGKLSVFQAISVACAPLNVQLVITHGGGLTPTEAASLPGRPLVVPYAPQLELLSRARLTITHAGLNTALDSLSCGVPMVAIPITFEQPGIAARIRWSRCGEVVPLAKIKTGMLARRINQVLDEPSYRAKAAVTAQAIQGGGGVVRAATIIETVVKSGTRE